MTDEPSPDSRVAALEQQLSQMLDTHRAALVQAGLRAEAARAGMVDLDGLKLLDARDVTLDALGEVVGGVGLMATMKRAKPWLFGMAGPAASSSHGASAPPAQTPGTRRATDMTHEEWRAARAELLRRR